jgi:amino-acid N-acetyltransferase
MMELSTRTVSIERATLNDGPAILRLLSDAALPVDGVLDHLDTAVVARAEGRVVGCAALEIYADEALLRSVAVDAKARGQRIGTQVTAAALDLAHALGVRVVYLLTTTAEGFFPRFAFERVDRQHVPSGVLASVEFKSACPSTAIVMRKRLAMADSRAE